MVNYGKLWKTMENHNFEWENMENYGKTPFEWKTMENYGKIHHFLSGKINYFDWACSIAMLVYQRVLGPKMDGDRKLISVIKKHVNGVV